MLIEYLTLKNITQKPLLLTLEGIIIYKYEIIFIITDVTYPQLQHLFYNWSRLGREMTIRENLSFLENVGVSIP